MPPKPFPTHFLCIPLVNATSRTQLTQSLEAFTADVTAANSFALPADAIRPVGTLHLTLGVFSFPKNEGLDTTAELLKSLRPKEILATVGREVAARTLPLANAGREVEGNEAAAPQTSPDMPSRPLSVTLRGLASMQTASKTSVLYAHPVDDQGLLQTFCERLRGVFIESGLMQEDSRPLLLHATVLNTIYAKAPPGERGGNKKRRGNRAEKLVFDARPILDRYEDQVWMENFPVQKLSICRMGAKKVEVDGVADEAYEAVADLDF
jgi:activating signal cointegrator complex subunit 1